jgi:hypothetical protein
MNYELLIMIMIMIMIIARQLSSLQNVPHKQSRQDIELDRIHAVAVGVLMPLFQHLTLSIPRSGPYPKSQSHPIKLSPLLECQRTLVQIPFIRPLRLLSPLSPVTE